MSNAWTPERRAAHGEKIRAAHQRKKAAQGESSPALPSSSPPIETGPQYASERLTRPMGSYRGGSLDQLRETPEQKAANRRRFEEYERGEHPDWNRRPARSPVILEIIAAQRPLTERDMYQGEGIDPLPARARIASHPNWHQPQNHRLPTTAELASDGETAER